MDTGCVKWKTIGNSSGTGLSSERRKYDRGPVAPPSYQTLIWLCFWWGLLLLLSLLSLLRGDTKSTQMEKESKTGNICFFKFDPSMGIQIHSKNKIKCKVLKMYIRYLFYVGFCSRYQINKNYIQKLKTYTLLE